MKRPSDDREYDKTQLKIGNHGKILHRDYTAHFFRWSFIRRMVPPGAKILDVGCGQEFPLLSVMRTSALGQYRPASYVGCDLNHVGKDPTSVNIDIKIYENFNFVERSSEITRNHPPFTHAVCLEVIEHMTTEHGLGLIRGIYGALKDGGHAFISTHCYDGQRHTKNHIHEYAITELQEMILSSGFKIERRFGTFIDLRQAKADKVAFEAMKGLEPYYDNNALSCILAPMIDPNLARNNLWVLKKEEEF